MTPERKYLSTYAATSTKNLILNALPGEVFARLLPNLERVTMKRGEFINRPQQEIDYIYFPESALVSLIATTPDGEAAEVGVVSLEGTVGIDVFLGTDSMYNESVIQIPGDLIRIKADVARREFERGEAFQKLILNVIRLLIIQISQTALCNRLHTIEQRLARWLLLCNDRIAGDNIALTQEYLAIMLGANRPGVTIAGANLQNIKLIKYTRGQITVLDRDGLRDFACSCYQIVKDEYDCFQDGI